MTGVDQRLGVGEEMDVGKQGGIRPWAKQSSLGIARLPSLTKESPCHIHPALSQVVAAIIHV